MTKPAKICSVCGARADVYEDGASYCAACFQEPKRLKRSIRRRAKHDSKEAAKQ